MPHQILKVNKKEQMGKSKVRKKSRQKTKSKRIRKRVFASGYHRVSRPKSFARSS